MAALTTLSSILTTYDPSLQNLQNRGVSVLKTNPSGEIIEEIIIPRRRGSMPRYQGGVSLITPTIVFEDITKFITEGPITLSPSSNSAGVFSFLSSNTDKVTISGNTANFVSISAGSSVITANQSAAGDYSEGSAAMTITLLHTYCIAEPCLNGGVCNPVIDGDQNFTCTCAEGFEGPTCALYDDVCTPPAPGSCRNAGICVADEDGGHCECTGCWMGDYCQTVNTECEA